MFERFTESARQSVFFARYEASFLGSPYIEVEHVLLGLLRASPFLRDLLGFQAVETFRKSLQRRQEQQKLKSASVDLPLSKQAKQILVLGAEEAKKYGQEHITCEHLFAGLLRQEDSFTHTFLREVSGSDNRLQHAVTSYLQSAQDRIAPPANRHPQLEKDWLAELTLVQPAPEFAVVHDKLSRLLLHCTGRMNSFDDAYGHAKLHRRTWTRKQALGYLTDQASQYRLWVARALTEPNVRGDRLPSEESVTAQPFDALEWQFMVESWFFANILLVRLIAALPGSKRRCRAVLESTRRYRSKSFYRISSKSPRTPWSRFWRDCRYGVPAIISGCTLPKPGYSP